MTKTIYHLIGIGGIGMSALARLLQQKGYVVRGSDKYLSEMLQKLQAEGMQVAVGHNKKHLHAKATVVYSSAIDKKNPEIQKAQELNLPCLHRSEALLHCMENHTSLVVTGTHGKTTTSALLAWVLHQAQKDPSFALGGVLLDLHTNARLGKGKVFVLEGDESDGSFLRCPADHAIITNLEEDHLNYWKTKKALHRAFQTFVDQMKDPSQLVWCYDDPHLRKMAPAGLSYGRQKGADAHITNVREGGGRIIFDLTFEGKVFCDIEVSTWGAFNALNASSVFLLAHRLFIEEEVIRRSLRSFPGIARRFTKKAEVHSTLFLDDYAHHPTEIAATLSAVKKQFPTRRLIAIFQPHRYSRTRDCWEGFCRCFSEADEVIVTDIYPASESPVLGITAEKLAREIEHCAAEFVGNKKLEQRAVLFKPLDIVITLGAGDITRKADDLIAAYSKSSQHWKVALIFGGRSVEHEIALLSTEFVRKNLDPDLYTVEEFFVGKDGTWDGQVFDANALKRLLQCDVCFPVFHGPFGEDGMMQGFLETLGLAYVGCDYHASSLTMNKDRTKLIALQEGILTPSFVIVRKKDPIEKITKKLAFPVWVKAVHLGSSLGVYRAASEKELEEKLQLAFSYDDRVLVEEEIVGRQIEFGVLGNQRLEVAAAAEILSHGKFHDFASKYGKHVAKTSIPPNLPFKVLEKGRQIAEKMYRACGCSGLARIDLFLDAKNIYWFNEINPMPGMTPTSPFPNMWKTSGVCGKELINRLIILALEKHRNAERKNL